MDLLAYWWGSDRDFNGLVAIPSRSINRIRPLFYLFCFLLNSLFRIRLLGSFFHVAMNGKAASDKIFTLLDTPVETQTQAVDFAAKNAIQVNIQDLHFSYSEEKPAIVGLDLSILPNQLTVFVGKSGCGKSTLVSLLMGFNKVQQGKILFNGQEIQEIDRHSFYEKVSLVSHSSYVFKGTLRENMKMAKVDATDCANLCLFRTSQSCAIRSR